MMVRTCSAMWSTAAVGNGHSVMGRTRPTLHALAAGPLHGRPGRARHRAVGEDGDLGVLHLELLDAADRVAVVVDLLAQVAAEALGHRRGAGGRHAAAAGGRRPGR